jgi:hypothetical protein
MVVLGMVVLGTVGVHRSFVRRRFVEETFCMWVCKYAQGIKGDTPIGRREGEEGDTALIEICIEISKSKYFSILS